MTEIIQQVVENYERKSRELTTEANDILKRIFSLIGIGIGIIILLPYLLNFLDRILIPSSTKIEVSDRVDNVDLQIQNTITSIPKGIIKNLKVSTIADLNPPIFTDQGVGVITGNRGALLVSIDGGRNWTPQDSGTSSYLNPPVFTNRGIGVITGISGALLVSMDGGRNWTQLDSGRNRYLNPPVFTDQGIGVITGNRGALLVSIDGGKNWSSWNSIETRDLNTPIFTDKGIGVITGSSGVLLVSTDGGKSWSSRSSNETRNLNTPIFTDKGIGVITGNRGALLVMENIEHLLSVQKIETLVGDLRDSTSSQIAIKLEVPKALGAEKTV